MPPTEPTLVTLTVTDDDGGVGVDTLTVTVATSFVATGSLVEARDLHTTTLLTDGTVLVVGGIGAGSLATAEIYDPGVRHMEPDRQPQRGPALPHRHFAERWQGAGNWRPQPVLR